MAVRDAEGKRRQLLRAGLAEFAAYGIAGARVDRIAKRAGCSAGLVYTYFNSKDELFEAVFDSIVEYAVSAVRITVDDLPGYAGRLYDSRQDHPEVARLVTWYRLERPGKIRPAVAEATRADVEAIRWAQKAGQVSSRFEAAQLLSLIQQLAAAEPPEASTDTAANRATIVEAVRRLVEF
jgi:AcrR family transcriptional regulator